MSIRFKFLTLMALAAFAGCSKSEPEPTPEPGPGPTPAPIAVDSVAIAPKEFSVSATDSIQLAATVFPNNAADKKIVWSSSDTTVAVVDSCGLVLALSEGTVTVTASAGGKSAHSRGTVSGPAVKAFELMPVDPLAKILRKQVDTEMDYPLEVARGETVTAQIRIKANEPVTGLKADVIFFCKEGYRGGTLVPPRLYWEREVFCTNGWNTWAGGKPSDALYAKNYMFPDPLMPPEKWSTDLNPAGTTTKDYEKLGLWCEFDIPRDFDAGNYKGRIMVTGKSKGEEVTAEADFAVTVYDVTLPKEQSLLVNNWNSCIYGTNLKYMNNGVEPETAEEKNELNSIIRSFMNDYGSNVWRIHDSRPNNGGGTKDGVKAVSVVDGQLKFDFDLVWGEEMRRILKDCPRLKMINGVPWLTVEETSAGSGVWTGKCNVKWVKEDGTLGSGTKEITDPVAQAYVSEYFKQLQAYLESQEMPDGRNTWLDCFAQSIFDEPNGSTYGIWNCAAAAIKNGGPKIKTLEAMCTSAGQIEDELIDYPCPKLNHIEELRATGGQTQWMYVCIDPQGEYANRFTLLPLMKVRILHWCNFYYDAPGFLHWGMNYWNCGGDAETPWGNQAGTFPGGDAWIIFPGYRECYPSIRLCAERDGIRDYELLKMVEQIDPSKAADFCHQIVTGQAQYNTDIANFRQTRHDILQYLSEQ